jgi:serine/threonine protein kinase/Tol biopolymer transport system component
MALTAGTRLGAFEIVAPLGAGGMGEVYRAHDTKLNREVAIKVLLAAVANDPERLVRFSREAQVLASLNHPNIAHIYGLEDSDGVRALVMELVEGPTLADRIAQGAIPLDDALPIAKQIAEALEAAHEQGIIHRDLKPANIKVRADGTVKVLDFGLAKALDPAGASSANATMSPTLSIHATQAGVILGTAAYMAPEQARGRVVDKRADIWAFGCVLYEMLTGLRAFAGAELSDTLAFVLTKAPDWTALPAIAPTPIRRLLRRCLEKDRAQRLADIADARLEIDEALTTPSESTSAASVLTPVRPARWRRALPWAIAAILGVGWVLVLGRWAPWRTTAPLAPQRLSVELGVDGTLPSTDAAFVLSPDGSLLAFVARTSGRAPQLYLRRLDQLMATPLSGTDGASSPFFSPDGQWVAFFADVKLKKVPVTGGAVVTLAEAPNPRGGWWAEDGTIVFAPGYRVGLMRVSAVGGQTQPLTTLAENEITHRFPQVLPGGAAVLYTASTEVNIGAGATLVVQPLPSGERIIVQRGGYFGRYVASGHIAYMQDDTLFAVPFDRQRLAVTGPAGRAIDGVRSDASRGSAQFAVSQMGTLAYLPGRNAFDPRPMAWMDRAGTIAALRAAPADWSNPEFSPDGQRIAMDIRGEAHSDIWVYDWARDTLTRVTSEGTNEEHPVWTPDGGRIVYRSFRSSTDPSGNTLSWKRADGSGDAQVLIQSKAALIPASWHPTKKVLAYVATMPRSGDDVMTLPVEGDEAGGWKPGQPTAVVNTAAGERAPTFSPDGRWLAYHSNESGRDEVYVRPFPGPGARVTVSSAGGETSAWSRARLELVFTAPAFDYRRVLMVAPYRVENDSFRPEKPRLWAERGSALRLVLGQRIYALHPDGVRVAIAPPSEGEAVGQNHLTLVLNFFDELRRIAPGQKKR